MSPPLPAHRPLPPGYVLDVYQFEQVLGNVETVIAHRQSVPDSAELIARMVF